MLRRLYNTVTSVSETTAEITRTIQILKIFVVFSIVQQRNSDPNFYRIFVFSLGRFLG